MPHRLMKLPLDPSHLDLPWNMVLAVAGSIASLALATWQFLGGLLAQFPTPDKVSGWQERDYASVTRAEVERIARQVWEPWVRDIADCDDQALFLTAACRKAAFAEGGSVPWGVGFIFTAGESAHAYTWALVLDEPGVLRIDFYDQTTGHWLPARELDQPITLTFG